MSKRLLTLLLQTPDATKLVTSVCNAEGSAVPPLVRKQTTKRSLRLVRGNNRQLRISALKVRARLNAWRAGRQPLSFQCGLELDRAKTNEKDIKRSSCATRTAKFRKKLIAAYRGRCAVTDCDAYDALEAAHILPYRGPAFDHVTNGLLRRADIHTLFDLNLIGIEPRLTSFLKTLPLKTKGFRARE
jgi:HNH endonuclease